jgi:hypothetical protein
MDLGLWNLMTWPCGPSGKIKMLRKVDAKEEGNG